MPSGPGIILNQKNERKYKNMITYFKMKHSEWKAKILFYGFVASIAHSTQKFFAAFNGISGDELRQELVSTIAGLAHEQAVSGPAADGQAAGGKTHE